MVSLYSFCMRRGQKGCSLSEHCQFNMCYKNYEKLSISEEIKIKDVSELTNRHYMCVFEFPNELSILSQFLLRILFKENPPKILIDFFSKDLDRFLYLKPVLSFYFWIAKPKRKVYRPRPWLPGHFWIHFFLNIFMFYWNLWIIHI